MAEIFSEASPMNVVLEGVILKLRVTAFSLLLNRVNDSSVPAVSVSSALPLFVSFV